MNEVKSLGYDRWLIYKQPHQESGLCCFSFAHYLQKCVTQIYRALNGDTMFVSFWGTQKLGNSNVLYFNKNHPVELKHCETLSSCRVFYLMKQKPEEEKYYLILEYDCHPWPLHLPVRECGLLHHISSLRLLVHWWDWEAAAGTLQWTPA